MESKNSSFSALQEIGAKRGIREGKSLENLSIRFGIPRTTLQQWSEDLKASQSSGCSAPSKENDLVQEIQKNTAKSQGDVSVRGVLQESLQAALGPKGRYAFLAILVGAFFFWNWDHSAFGRVRTFLTSDRVVAAKNQLHAAKIAEQSNPSAAREAYSQAESGFGQAGLRKQQLSALINRGRMEYLVGDSATALATAQLAKSLAARYPELDRSASVLLARVYLFRGDTEDARLLLSGIEAPRVGSEQSKLSGVVLLGMADTARALGDHSKSRKLYESALGRARRQPSPLDIAAAELGLAQLDLARHNPLNADERARRASGIYSTLNSVVGRGQSLQIQASAAAALGDHTRAQQLLDAALSAHEQAGVHPELASCLRRKAMFLRTNVSPQEALSVARTARGYFRQMECPQGEASCLLELCQIRHKLGDPENAYRHAKAAYQKYTDCGDSRGMARTQIVEAELLIYDHEYSLALEKLLPLLEMESSEDYQSQIRMFLGRTYRMQGVFDLALEHLNAALSGSDLQYDHSFRADCLIEKGQCFRLSGNDGVALDMFLEATKEYEAAGMRSSARHARILTAEIHRHQGRDEAAIVLYQKAAEDARTENDANQLGNALLGIGQIASKSDESRARGALQEAREIFSRRAGGNLHGVLIVLGNLERKHSNWNDALQLFEQSLEHSNGNAHAIASSHAKIGGALLGLNRNEEAISHLELALETFESLGDTRGAANMQVRIAQQVASSGGDKDEAIQLLKAAAERYRSETHSPKAELGFALVIMGSLQVERNQEDARTNLREGVKLSKQAKSQAIASWGEALLETIDLSEGE